VIINIFSNFDPIWFNLCYKDIATLYIIPILITSRLWYGHSKTVTMIISPIMLITSQLKRTKSMNLKNTLLVINTLFMFIIYFNIAGILPYMFSATSHIITTLSMGLPMWLLLLIRRITASPKKTIRHLLPDRAPTWLNPFLVIIESVRISVRPVTLSFRLAANITAGHVVLSLMASFSITTNLKIFMALTTIINLYIIFELAICLIQAYIFCLLISLYRNDHS